MWKSENSRPLAMQEFFSADREVTRRVPQNSENCCPGMLNRQWICLEHRRQARSKIVAFPAGFCLWNLARKPKGEAAGNRTPIRLPIPFSKAYLRFLTLPLVP
jgi:hypothetical protein